VIYFPDAQNVRLLTDGISGQTYQKEMAFLLSLSHKLKGKDAPDIRYNISTRNAYQSMLFFVSVKMLSSK